MCRCIYSALPHNTEIGHSSLSSEFKTPKRNKKQSYCSGKGYYSNPKTRALEKAKTFLGNALYLFWSHLRFRPVNACPFTSYLVFLATSGARRCRLASRCVASVRRSSAWRHWHHVEQRSDGFRIVRATFLQVSKRTRTSLAL